MRTSLRLGVVAAIALAAFIGGYKLRPRLNAETFYTAYAKYLLEQPSHKQALADGVIDTVIATDFRRLIDISSAEDVETRRRAMAAYLFRGEPAGLQRRPDKVERDVLFPPLVELKLAAIDILTVSLPFGVDSQVYFLRAEKPRSCLMIYQEGHRVSFLERKRFLRRVVAEGCDVLALSLPLTGGMNSRPLVDHPRFGHLLLNDPDDLQLLDSQHYSSLAYFIVPLVAALNHALDQRPYDLIGATGFSGGGWAVEVFAALDSRVQATYSVAGSSPTGVHAAMPQWGSPEQRQGKFYEIANYGELYVMSADRPGRRHHQFFNETDPCCFSGHLWTSWNAPVAERARSLGGEFRLFSYRNPAHSVTKPVALAIVDDFLNGGRALPEGVVAH